MSRQITDDNIKFVRDQIDLKNQDETYYYTTGSAVKNCVTDRDHYPYTRYYRGVYYKTDPIILEREAGYRKEEGQCYNPSQSYIPNPPELCFEAPCSTVYPCYPRYLKKYSDKEELEVMLNKTCVDKSP